MSSIPNKLIDFEQKREVRGVSNTKSMQQKNSDGELEKRNKSKTMNYNNIKEEVAFDMEDNKILEKYLDKIDQDRRDQEERLSRNIEESEKRIHNERTELERRFSEDSKAREERMEKKFNETMNSLKETNKKIDAMNSKLDEKVDAINSKLDGKVDTINSKIDEKMDRMTDKIDNTNKWIIGLCISTIIGIAAIAGAVLFGMWQLK